VEEQNEDEDDTVGLGSDYPSGHGEDEPEDTCPSPPRKKPHSGPSATGAAPAMEGQNLGPRKPMMAAQLDDKEQEEARRRAVAKGS